MKHLFLGKIAVLVKNERFLNNCDIYDLKSQLYKDKIAERCRSTKYHHFPYLIPGLTRSTLGPTTSFNLSVFRLMRSLPPGFLDMLDKLTRCNMEKWFAPSP